MLPSLVAHELQLSLQDYLRAAFPISTPHFRGDGQQGETALIDRFIETPGKLVKGPYLSLGLPFRRDAAPPPFRHVDPGFPPFRHQQLAFQRLNGETKASTLVATGTGSGKTECFLLPILEHCAARRADPTITEKRGIKALIVYPMNALATDQARRMAKLVSQLDIQLTVGLFTGDSSDSPSRVMSPESVITDKETLRDNPPDILLTNYKMLDFLLMRPKDQPLWRFNTPGMLRYLVVDELHTFDGAQGTDLACLIRRLRDRLSIGDELACVGTSATIGDASASDQLRQYASEIFATQFAEESLVLEDRLSAEEYLDQASGSLGEPAFHHWPSDLASRQRLDPQRFAQPEAYLAAAFQQWFIEGSAEALTDPRALGDARHPEHGRALVALGCDLKRHEAFHRLLLDSQGVTDLETLLQRWKRERHWSGDAHVVLYSLLAMVSAAREAMPGEHDEPRLVPLLTVRLQLWLRELTRMVSRVGDTAELLYADDDPQGRPAPGRTDQEGQSLHLPLVHCRDCHSAAWGTLKADDDRRINDDLAAFYRQYFQQGADVCLLYPLGESPAPPQRKGQSKQLCPACRALTSGDAQGPCPDCGAHGLLRVWQPSLQEREKDRLVTRTDHCPCCLSRGGLSILGFRAASLSSTLLARLYQSPYNDDRKAIAFSDSVQDAAHRAGFFEARTWRQALRQAMNGWLSGHGQSLSLDRLGSAFAEAMRQQAGSDADFVGRWLAPNMAWLKDADYLQREGQLPADSDLPELVRRRLDWELHTELGLRSQIGRTLERQGRVTLTVDTTLLEAAAERLANDWAEELPGIGEIDSAQTTRFLLGVLHRLRTRGAFAHPEVEGYVRDGGNSYFFRRHLCLPNYGPRAAPPAFLTLEPISQNFDSISGQQRGGGAWYQGWFLKQLEDDQVLANDVAQAYRLALRALERNGLIRTVATPQGREVWGLERPHWHAVTQPLPMRCSRCGQRHQVAQEQMEYWQGMKCLQPQCGGELAPTSGFKWALPPSGASPTRLVSHEHTGLLESDERARVERSFISGQRPWDINLLSATPTLEMGIDIGDLSSVLLCSTPPSQANYLQRIGRAGRRDGNALNVTIANAAPHDLYFYAEPREMMAGSVQPPGVFLQATAVLERQLMAFAFDHWVAEAAQGGTLDETMLPARLSVVLDNMRRGDKTGFPHSLLTFIDRHEQWLFEQFCALFPALDDEARRHLHDYFTDKETTKDSLRYRINNRLHDKARQRQSWRDTIRAHNKQLERLRQQPEDEAIREAIEAVESEKRALQEMAKRLDAQHTLNFFTDEGLLPNYAFPEEGVTLNGVVIRSVRQAERDNAGGDNAGPARQDKPAKSYEVISYDFQRPAQNALVELAPENTFYAVGRALKIDQVNMRLSDIETWRLCNHCHHSEQVDGGDLHGGCPRCGSPQWADSAQKRQLLRLREVTATVRDRDSRIADDSEQREPSFYVRQLLTDIAPNSARFAYRLDDPECPFGFEYIPGATFREINFGRHDDKAPAFKVAGEEQPRGGFRVCKHCGKIQRPRMKPSERHQRFCKKAQRGAIEQEEDFVDSLFLYRELTSEALRLLLPLSDIAMSDTARHSLIAALHLGLKKHFHGNVDHLRVTEQQTPSQGSQPSRHYLVLHDSVPGGTGYLKELMQSPETLLAMLGTAHEHLAGCDCQYDEQLDGCYRCLLAYRESRNMVHISRRRAMELLERILSRRDSLVAIDGLEEVDLNALVESELEQRFIDGLASRSADVRLLPELHEGTSGWRLTITTGQAQDGTPRLASWRIEPQRNLGPADDVMLATRPDFMLWPASESHRQARPVALYLDGFQYHRDQLDDDTAKRQAVLASGRFHVWSLGWRDLEGAELEVPLWQRETPQHLGDKYQQLADQLNILSRHAGLKALKTSALDWLLAYLRTPDETSQELAQASLGQAFHWLDPRTLKEAGLRQAIDLELAENAPPAMRQRLMPEAEPVLLGGVMNALGNSDAAGASACSEVAVSISPEAMQNVPRLSRELHLHLSLDDRHLPDSSEGEARWRAFWQAANLLQFMPRFSMISVRGVANGRVCDALATCASLADFSASSRADHSTQDSTQDGAQDSTRQIDAGWQALLADDLVMLPEAFVRQLASLGLPVPTPGLDVLDRSGEASITLELAWESARVAVALEEDLPADWPSVLGEWQIVTTQDDAAVETLAGWLGNETRSEA
ncbi:DEAD/DEAH box helicase [Halomonas almeriensis]|uniref:DEAD/DEAH box helicase n=1 Tax=Halomonas almeriensis TaxID=308163 RepID=UPI0025B4FAF6|nr:DEAD/DEAH box helicase [Halomonas almeriensis]MDN3552884.1 DEAD/DEAH box helicase [Halomonas almeriensis]